MTVVFSFPNGATIPSSRGELSETCVYVGDESPQFVVILFSIIGPDYLRAMVLRNTKKKHSVDEQESATGEVLRRTHSMKKYDT